MSKRLKSNQRRTDLGVVTPMEGDFLYIAKARSSFSRTRVQRLVLSAREGHYDLIEVNGCTQKTITRATAQKLFAKQWDIYQRIIT